MPFSLLPSHQNLNTIFADFNQQVVNQSLELAIAELQQSLTVFANLPESELLEKFALAFGSDFDQQKAIAIINNWQND